MSADSIISLQNVDVFQQDQLILTHVNLEIKTGEFVYLIGKVGSGKSSLIKVLNAELELYSGEAMVAGFNLRKLKSSEVPFLRRKLGVIFQDFRLLTDRNVHDNLSFVLKATGWKIEKAIENRINEVMERVGMKSKLKSMPHELSGGEQQRVVIARAILNDPDIILADEPTGNLDPETSDDLMGIFKEINAQGKTILVVTHDYHILNRYPARTLVCASHKVSDSSKTQQEVDFSELLEE
ncbi:ATP-binding cassette domain-containing protein [uncultured Sunxiuqinia sp.]|jgi:cell division transport system ATP-binding protein|uniref:cell division ATP-binding protein FtsE n=1 Tax=uncultured Sunxiuqinia sp. TaxID=1573825 RepID=UPI00199F7DB3|nr:ATP-binding cassette domain-containing protein [Sunxiuqinia sp.]|tara:strand:+ start:11897 stop:12613 length:717 start_codon:yes stop_codon:yes gene_type:complete